MKQCKIEKVIKIMIWVTCILLSLIMCIAIYAGFSTSDTALKIKQFNQIFVVVKYEK